MPVTLTRPDEATEAAATAEFQECLGKVAWATTLWVSQAADEGFERLDLKTPALIRIQPTPEEDICRWMDHGIIDPVYQVELLVPHPELGEDCLPAGVDGASCHGDERQARDPATFEIADAATQERFAGAPGLVFGEPEPDTSYVALCGP